jgi:multiple antibiotic resistance protein
MAMWTAFLLSLSALLPIINPLGSAIVLLGLVGEAPPSVYRTLARRIAINNIIFLGVVELVGSAILNFFGISLPIVQLAGGLVVTALGWNVLNESDPDATAREKQEDFEEASELKLRTLQEKTFYPFTFPITSGPGTMVTMLTLTAHISSRALSDNVLGHAGIFLAVVVVSLLCYLCYRYAAKITTRISSNSIHGILRVIAFILLCIGVQIAWNGLSALIGPLVKH